VGGAIWGLSLGFPRALRSRAARALFVGSLVYLPVLWAAMIVSKR